MGYGMYRGWWPVVAGAAMAVLLLLVVVAGMLVFQEVWRNRSLYWKEWKEQKWRTYGLCFVASAAMALSFLGESSQRYDAFLTLMMLCSLLLPVFAAMAIGTENRLGTLRSLLARPVDKQSLFLAKTLVGAVSVTLPVLCVGGTATFLATDYEIRTMHLFDVTVSAAGLAVVAWLWMMAFATTARNEAQAGMWSVMVLMVWASVLLVVQLFVMAVLAFLFQFPWETSDVPEAVMLLHPLGIVPQAFYGHVTWVSWWHVPIAIFIWHLSQKQYGEVEVSPDVSLEIAPVKKAQPPQPGDVAPLSPTGRQALWWKEWRVSWMAIVAQCVMYLLLFVFAGMGNLRYALEVATMMLLLMTPFVAVLAGVGGVGWELDRRLLDFVRSRPIDSRQWFASKYVCGLLTSLLIPTVLVVELMMLGLGLNRPFLLHQETNALVALLGSWALIYTVSITIAVTVRHPVYSGVLAFLLTLVVYLLPSAVDERDWQSLLLWAGDRLWRWDPTLESVFNAYWGGVVFLAACVVSAVLVFFSRWFVQRQWRAVDDTSIKIPHASPVGV